MPKLIVLRGAPSSGKSSIAKSLRSLKKKTAWLKVDGFKPLFAKDIFEEDQAVEIVNRTAIATLEFLLSQGFSVVMEGIFQNPEHISLAVEIAKKHGGEYRVYELECSLETLQARDKVREGVKEGCRRPLGDKVIARLNQVIVDNPWEGAEKLNTEDLSLKECVEKIAEELSRFV